MKKRDYPLAKSLCEYVTIFDSINTNIKIYCKHPDDTNHPKISDLEMAKFI